MLLSSAKVKGREKLGVSAGSHPLSTACQSPWARQGGRTYLPTYHNMADHLPSSFTPCNSEAVQGLPISFRISFVKRFAREEKHGPLKEYVIELCYSSNAWYIALLMCVCVCVEVGWDALLNNGDTIYSPNNSTQSRERAIRQCFRTVDEKHAQRKKANDTNLLFWGRAKTREKRDGRK